MLVDTHTVTETWTVFVPGKVFTLNGERKFDRYKRARRVREWREGAWAEALRARLPKRLGAVEITATPVLATRRSQDVAGCYPVVKAAIDGIVDAGVLYDDGPDVVRALCFRAPEHGDIEGMRLEMAVA